MRATVAFLCKGSADFGVPRVPPLPRLFRELRSAENYERTHARTHTRVTRPVARETRAEIASAPRRESARKSSTVRLIFSPPSRPASPPRRVYLRERARARALLSPPERLPRVRECRTSGPGYLRDPAAHANAAAGSGIRRPRRSRGHRRRRRVASKEIECARGTTLRTLTGATPSSVVRKKSTAHWFASRRVLRPSVQPVDRSASARTPAHGNARVAIATAAAAAAARSEAPNARKDNSRVHSSQRTWCIRYWKSCTGSWVMRFTFFRDIVRTK